jgi:hypothetical protein
MPTDIFIFVTLLSLIRLSLFYIPRIRTDAKTHFSVFQQENEIMSCEPYMTSAPLSSFLFCVHLSLSLFLFSLPDFPIALSPYSA